MLIIATNLKTLRETHNYTQDYVADYLGISQNTYSIMERGANRVVVQRLRKLAILYNIPICRIVSSNETSEERDGSAISQMMIASDSIFEPERKLFVEMLERFREENERFITIIEQLTEQKK